MWSLVYSDVFIPVWVLVGVAVYQTVKYFWQRWRR